MIQILTHHKGVNDLRVFIPKGSLRVCYNVHASSEIRDKYDCESVTIML